MNTVKKSRPLLQLAAYILTAPFWAAIGFVWILVRLARIIDGVGTMTAVMRPEVLCPNGHPNPTEGVFECGHCGARYEGSVWVCSFCKSPAKHIPCVRCGLSIHPPYGNLP